MQKKRRLEAQGFSVTIEEAKPTDNPLLTIGDQVFRQRHKGQRLPAFALRDVTGQWVRSQDLVGKRVHLNFWSTTCAPCMQEFTDLNALQQKYQTQGWVFLAFAPEQEKLVKRVLAQHPLGYTVMAGAKDYYQQLGIDGYPKNFFVDWDGTIVEVTDGTVSIRDATGKLTPDNVRFYDRIMAAMQ
ncbi:TlpA family protein disulfide reductase [Hymenobacter sp. BT507]|uniref:TlpA family protein disulfide reductase n=1 Tax=Hymenobacter citatus TaxID=2763506 RepID=A0ABR7MQ11_9BACT|nr:TlpA family protein disulfide reductase [Hymenobacter citatus]